MTETFPVCAAGAGGEADRDGNADAARRGTQGGDDCFFRHRRLHADYGKRRTPPASCNIPRAISPRCRTRSWAHAGTVDKFIGDAVMAFWNAPADDPDHAAHACAAALAVQRANDRLNAEFEREGWPAYRTRCGLHSGDAVVGNIGSEDRMNYTALGATVNLAARLEGLNKNYGTLILVSSALQQRTASGFVFRSVDGSARRVSPKRSKSTSCDARAARTMPRMSNCAGNGRWSMRRFAMDRWRSPKASLRRF